MWWTGWKTSYLFWIWPIQLTWIQQYLLIHLFWYPEPRYFIICMYIYSRTWRQTYSSHLSYCKFFKEIFHWTHSLSWKINRKLFRVKELIGLTFDSTCFNFKTEHLDFQFAFNFISSCGNQIDHWMWN